MNHRLETMELGTQPPTDSLPDTRLPLPPEALVLRKHSGDDGPVQREGGEHGEDDRDGTGG